MCRQAFNQDVELSELAALPAARRVCAVALLALQSKDGEAGGEAGGEAEPLVTMPLTLNRGGDANQAEELHLRVHSGQDLSQQVYRYPNPNLSRPVAPVKTCLTCQDLS